MSGPCGHCCGSCRESLNCHPCCKCVPKYLCVSVASADEGCSCQSASELFTVSVSGSEATWSGSISCGDLTIDLALKIEKESCNLYLESSCLGLTGANRLIEEMGIGRCLRDADLPITFNVTGASGCGYDLDCENLTITVSSLGLVDNPNNCGDCEKVYPVLCLRYNHGSSGDPDFYEFTAEVEVDANEGTWTTEVELEHDPVDDPEIMTVVVSLECDEYTGETVVRITATSSTYGVLTDTIGGCDGCAPRIDGSLCITEVCDRIVTVTSKICGSCNPVVTDCCPDMSRTLFLSVENLSGCDCLDYGEESYELNYSDSEAAWLAIGDFMLCEDVGASNQELWRLQCQGSLWELQILCAARSYNPTSDQCEPLELIFDADVSPDCCGGTVRITITE